MSRQIKVSPTLLPNSPNLLARRWFGLLFLAVLVVGILITIFLVKETFAHTTVAIDINGNVREVRTDAHTVGEALQDAGILIDAADKVTPPLETRLNDKTTITIVKANQLVLEIGGEVRRVYTHSTDPLIILTEQSITLGPKDVLYVDNRPYQPSQTISKTPPHYLQVIRAKNYTLIDQDQPITDQSVAHTVGEVLDENHVTLYLADQISPSPNTPLIDGVEIVITRSNPVQISVDGQQLRTRAVGTTVNDVLNMLGFPLLGFDYTIPAENTPFSSDMAIQVVRVVEDFEVEQSPIPFEVVMVSANDLGPDEQRIIQAGVPGVQEARVRVRRENDQIVSRVIQEIWTVVDPIPQIVAYGGSPQE
ncbi:MAG: DUF348 domain-containing protein [Chloroflexi bacterium]|nr:DUF348 domain-containing protein [Chloroflexota bacterium]